MTDFTDDELFEELMQADEQSVPHFVLSDNPPVDDDTAKERLSVCINCEFMKNMTCQKENSLIFSKIKAEDTYCPEGKW